MRRYDLDWLRVIAFGLLIFYHVGMLFVPWDFHIKNNITYQWLTYPMWFILYLLLFSLMLTPLFLYIKKHTGSRIHTRFGKVVTKPMGLYLFAIPLYLTEVFVEPFFPVTHALVGDWFAIIFYLILFLSGFILITFKDHFWSTVKINRRSYLIAGIITFH